MHIQDKIITFLFILIAAMTATGWYLFTHQEQTTFLPPNSLEDDDVETEEQLSSTTVSILEENTSPTFLRNSIYVSPKAPSSELIIDLVLLNRSGFVALMEKSDMPTGEVAGVSALLIPGEHVSVPVSVDEEPTNGTRYDAMIYHDDGDGVFDVAQDKVARDDLGYAYYTELLIESLYPTTSTSSATTTASTKTSVEEMP